MKSRPPPDRHLDVRVALDYLDGRLDPRGERAVEAHLALPCAGCRERLRALGALVHTMRLDRLPPVPGVLRARARAAYAPPRPVAPEPGLLTRAAALVFDSLTAPLPAMARRAVGEARRLRYTLGDGRLEVECEPVEAGIVALRGRLAAEEAALHRIEVVVGSESFAAWPDAAGGFTLERVPAGEARIAVAGPSGHFNLPRLTLQP